MGLRIGQDFSFLNSRVFERVSKPAIISLFATGTIRIGQTWRIMIALFKESRACGMYLARASQEGAF